MVPLTEPAVAEAYAGASSRLAVFVQGWSVTESCWSWRPRAQADELPDPDTLLDYGARLRRDLGYTPVYVRYNTGLHISENGRLLTDLLETLVGLWPSEVETVARVGYSMGGLVARSACHYAAEFDHGWLQRVGPVVCLGTPHLGAPLEKGAHVLGWVLGQFPETEALGGVVNSRSSGVKDLRFGAVTSDHWSVHDAEELLVDRVAGSGATGTQEVYLLSARLAAEDSPAAAVLGDLLVPVSSASGQGSQRSVPVVPDGLVRISGLSHLGLLNNAEVYAALRTWLTPTE